jgi:RHS repeat-associated protein
MLNHANSSFTLEQVVDYFPYGKVLRQFVNAGGPERYMTTQHERDQETGLDYRGARYYDSDVARFLGLDPAQAEYPAWSSYSYVMGNPVSLIDPDGRRTDGYEDADGNYQWFDEHTEKTFKGEGGKQWNRVTGDRALWAGGIEQVNAVRAFLTDLGQQDAAKDVRFQRSATYGGKYATLLNADKHTANWTKGAYDSRNKTNDARTSAALNLVHITTGVHESFSSDPLVLKYYPSRDQSVGLSQTGVSHFLEAGFEIIDGMLREQFGADDMFYDMHGGNARWFMRFRNLERSGSPNYHVVGP